MTESSPANRRAGRTVVHVARDDKRAEAMRAALAVLAPDVVVLDFPAWDCLPFDRGESQPRDFRRGGWRRWRCWRMG